MKKLLIAAAAVAFATPAMAATDGELSTTSSAGTVEFNVNIPKMVRVSGLDDMTINVTPAMLTEPYFSREDANDTFCVYSNDGVDGAYAMTVSATSNTTGSGGAFQLNGPEALPYAVWTSDDTGNKFKNYSYGQTTSYLAGADGNGRATTLDCSNRGDNANIHVGVNDSALIAAQAGSYTDTITVTVSTL